MLLKSVLICVSFCIQFSLQSEPSENHYWAGVVEYTHKETLSNTTKVSPHNRTLDNLEKYKEVIRSAEAYPVDIMVFPEGALNTIDTAVFVPNPEDSIFPCNDLDYEGIVQELSCLARSRRKYLVINLIEKATCLDPGNPRSCSTDDSYRFNTNVVFDRKGIVIARYRKINLISEYDIDKTVEPELVKFHTDFGVTFGTFICFDLMFYTPALQLVRQNVTDFVFPTMWSCQLTFWSAFYIQRDWAYENNVNLLVAGANHPRTSTTGSGMYAGKRGRIVATMSHIAGIKLFVTKVPKIGAQEGDVIRQPINDDIAEEMTDHDLNRNQVDGYATMGLPLSSNDRYSAKLCHNELCCSFTLNYTVDLPTDPDAQHYRYRLVVYDGNRTLVGENADVIITTCGILACSEDRFSTCGIRHFNASSVENVVQFNSIEVIGDFPEGEGIFLVPSSTDTSNLPLELDEFDYSHQKSDSHNFVQYYLTSPRSELLSFAIRGRKFVYSNTGTSWTAGILGILAGIFTALSM
ncbi:vanin-like protein 1 [Toxorhynchites rutilus septentrionalis]|uniref:vanin-like protein 1 n=1 Tax=Toxorhynchites rutilus septentrionalis TaxID=329112 RepID=UPI0024794E00|nr:vanin-like protein 1 [Toxorhynchites rutilus septentrionalis]